MTPEGRTRHTDTTEAFARVAGYRDHSYFTSNFFSGTSQSEDNPQADTNVQITKSSAKPTVKTTLNTESAVLKAGIIAIVPQNTWDQFHSPEPCNADFDHAAALAEPIEDAEPPL